MRYRDQVASARRPDGDFEGALARPRHGFEARIAAAAHDKRQVVRAQEGDRVIQAAWIGHAMQKLPIERLNLVAAELIGRRILDVAHHLGATGAGR